MDETTRGATRRTLSGKRVPREQHHPTWHELVQKPAKVEPKQRTGTFYTTPAPDFAAVKADGTPAAVGPVVEFPEDYRGGRSPRRSAVYSKALALRFGVALTKRREALHPQRVAKRDRIRRERLTRQRQQQRDAA